MRACQFRWCWVGGTERKLCGRDVDRAFAYTVPRQVEIRDARIGVPLFLLRAVIVLYTIFYSIVVNRGYVKTTEIFGVTRIQALAPALPYRSTAPPYCASTTAPVTGAPYAINASAKTFVYTGGMGGVSAPQAQCSYLDEKWLVPEPLEASAAFLPTFIAANSERNPCGSRLDNATCLYSRFARTGAYIPDVEFFTLLLDHSIVSPALGQSWTQMSMRGALLDRQGAVVDPCAAYAKVNASVPCPVAVPGRTTSGLSCISVGALGVRDIVSLASLLQAGGVASLDEPGGDVSPVCALHLVRGARHRNASLCWSAAHY